DDEPSMNASCDEILKMSFASRSGTFFINSDEAFPFQMQDDFLRSFLRCELGRIDDHFCIVRLLVGIRNAGEFLNNSSPRLRVETFAIALFAYINRRGEMHHNKSAKGLDHRTHMFASGVIWRDRSTNCDAAVFGDLGSDVSDAVNVEISMFSGKAEF